jgi:heme exporter protein B
LRLVHESVLARCPRQHLAPIWQISRDEFKVKKLVIVFELFPRLGNWLRETILITKKDLAIERSTGEIVTTSGFFAILLTVLSSLAFSGRGLETDSSVAPAVVWLSVTFASVLGLSRTWHREREEGALRGLIVAPVARSAIFAGKAIGVFAFITVIEFLVVPVSAVLLGFDLGRHAGVFAIVALLANVGVAATGTLFGAMTVRTRARDLVLASVLLPLLAPTLGSAVVATRDHFDGVPLGDLGDYFELMAVFDVVFTAAGLGLFGWLIEG